MAKRFFSQLLSVFLYNPYLGNFISGKIHRGAQKAVCVPGLNCYSCPAAVGACPLGAFQASISGVVLRFPFYVLGLTMLFGLVAGRAICGWVCPFGFVQEALYRLPTKKLGKNSVTKFLSRAKFFVAMLFVIAMPLLFWSVNGIGEPAFCKFVCPSGTLFAAVPLLLKSEGLRATAGELTVLKFSLLALFLTVAVFLFRPFCRFVCPLGAFYGLFNRFALFGIAVEEKRCTHCGACRTRCKLDITVAGDTHCISCGECRDVCPERAIHYRKLTKNFQTQKEEKVT